MARAKPLAAGAPHSLTGKTPEAACEAAFAYGEASFPQLLPHPEATRYALGFCYRHYAETGFYVGIFLAPDGAYSQYGVYIMGDPGSGFDTSPTPIGWWDELPIVPAPLCQAPAPTGSVWTRPVLIGGNIFGTWSAVTLDDRSTLVLKQEQSVDPNELTLIQYDCQGQALGTWPVASRPAAVGNIGRATLYSPLLKTDGYAAWVIWRQYEPNDNNSDEVESAQIRRWTPLGGLAAALAIEPRYGGSVEDADLDVAPDGSVVVAWLESVPNAPIPVHFGPKLAAAMTWSPAAGWSSPSTLVSPNSTPGQDLEKITASTPAAGQAAVAWIRHDSMGQMIEGVQMRGDGWSAPEEIFRDTTLYPSSIVQSAPTEVQWKVVMDQTGGTTAIWAWNSWNFSQSGISYNYKPAAGAWAQPRLIAPLGSEATISVSIARNGLGAIAWRAGYNVAVTRFNAGTLIDLAYLTYDEPFMGAAMYPEVVADVDGHVAAVWTEVYSGGLYGILGVARGSRFQPGSGWLPNVTLSTDEAPTRPINVANAAGGMASFVWVHGELGVGASRAGAWLAPFSMSP